MHRRNRNAARRPRRALVVLPLVAVATTAVAACGNGGDAPAAEDPGVSHVHGLGVDPADGTLYAATHHGVFRIPKSGSAKRVADRYQDTMAFTVVGPKTFLASGHPELDDPRLNVEGKPPLLGLVETKDAAETWMPLSLLGEADFHALASAHGLVYGLDATSSWFMVTSDRRTWERRAQVALSSFAVSPSDPNIVVGATGEGVRRSTDGGRTWFNAAAAPAGVWLSWAPDGLWAVAADGGLHRSDEGTTWTPRGRVPGDEPQALLATGTSVFVSTTSGIHESVDGGVSWDLRYRDATATDSARR